MRKALIILAILLALSFGILVSTAVSLDRQHEAITITEETLYGDPAAAEGLQVDLRAIWEHQLFWDTTYMAGENPEPKTVFTYSDERIYEDGAYTGSFDLQLAMMNCGISGTISLEAEVVGPEGDMLWLPVLDVAERTAPGEERTEIVDLADYYDYFPVSYHFNPKEGYPYDGNGESLLKFFRETFLIPIPKDLQLTVTICKDEEGRIYNIDTNEGAVEVQEDGTITHVGNTNIYAYSPSVVLKDGVFFGLCGTVDFSYLPNGYGIYYMPVKLDEAKDFAAHNRYGTRMEYAWLQEKAVNIYPMDPADCEEVSLYLSDDEEKLYAITKEQGVTKLTVFDSSTCEQLQQFELGTKSAAALWCENGVVIVVLDDENWEDFSMQIYLEEDGCLQPWLETDMPYFQDETSYWYVDPELAFDGERLAIVRYFDNYSRMSHRIMIFDQQGLRYAGDYYHNGDDLADSLAQWEDGLQISWQSPS